MVKDVWWDNVIFREFAAHFISMSDEQVVRDIRESVVKVINLDESGDSFGANMVRRAKERLCGRHDVAVQNGTKGGRPRKETTADGDIREDSQGTRTAAAITRNEPLEHDPLEPSATISAVAPTREDGEFKSDSGNAGNLESATTATIYGDAESGDASEATTTISDNMRRVPQNEAPAHGFSGGRTAQGTMSRSPEAAAQSGKVYDQETFQVSTDEARQSQALESRRTDGHSLRVGNVARPPVRSPGRKFRNKEEFIQWAIDTGLDPDDAGNCWEATMERGGLTKDGKKVDNLCAYAVKWCRTSKKNRETA